jgi:hypothetical protein
VASLLRVHAKGCDGTNDHAHRSRKNKAERDALPNSSMRSYDAILERIKARLSCSSPTTASSTIPSPGSTRRISRRPRWAHRRALSRRLALGLKLLYLRDQAQVWHFLLTSSRTEIARRFRILCFELMGMMNCGTHGSTIVIDE